MNGDPGPVCAVAISPTGKWGASCALRLMSRDMAVQLWDFTTGTERRRLRGATDSVSCIALNFDGRRVAAGDRSGAIHIWALESPASPPTSFAAHIGTVTGIAFNADGTSIFSCGLDGTVRQRDLQTGNAVELVCGNAGAVRGIAISKANGLLAVAGEMLLLRQSDGTMATLDGHNGGALCVAISADGLWLASGGNDRVVRLWRTRDGSELASFEGHEGSVRAIAISHDRRFIYSGGDDGTLRRWAIGAAN
jgi:WD40 repeat protein